jgi:hypothetical protein
MTRFVGVLALVLAAWVYFGSTAVADDDKASREVDAVFHKLDTNMDGRLSKDEFLKIAERFRDRDKARKQLGQTYDRLDPNQKGITGEQFRSLVEARKREVAGKKKVTN